MKYEVRWQTNVGIGQTFYSNVERVDADSPEEAAQLAQDQVWRRAFMDKPKSFVKVISIK